MTPEERIVELGLELPQPVKKPPGVELPFTFVNVRGNRALISGHPKQDSTGSVVGPYGRFGSDHSTEQGYDIARDIGLSVLANLKAEIGELSRVAGWVRVFGMVNSDPDFIDQHLVINGFSDLMIAVFGSDVGRHARSAIGVAGLPMNFAIEIEAEVELADS